MGKSFEEIFNALPPDEQARISRMAEELRKEIDNPLTEFMHGDDVLVLSRRETGEIFGINSAESVSVDLDGSGTREDFHVDDVVRMPCTRTVIEGGREVTLEAIVDDYERILHVSSIAKVAG